MVKGGRGDETVFALLSKRERTGESLPRGVVVLANAGDEPAGEQRLGSSALVPEFAAAPYALREMSFGTCVVPLGERQLSGTEQRCRPDAAVDFNREPEQIFVVSPPFALAAHVPERPQPTRQAQTGFGVRPVKGRFERSPDVVPFVLDLS